jgi:hypothetical protein
MGSKLFKLVWHYLCDIICVTSLMYAVNIWIPEPKIQTIRWTEHFLVLVFKWFGFQMFCFQMFGFIKIKLSKLDQKSDGHSSFGSIFKWPFKNQTIFLVFKWLQQNRAQHGLVLLWPVSAEIDHSKTRLVQFSDAYCIPSCLDFQGNVIVSCWMPVLLILK